MISEIRTQRDEILEAKDEVDDRRRFIEAVLSGVTAAVIGVEQDRRIAIVNSSAETLMSLSAGEMLGKQLVDIAPEVDHVLTEAAVRYRGDFRKQIALVRGGTVRTLSVQVTREEVRDMISLATCCPIGQALPSPARRSPSIWAALLPPPSPSG